MSGALDWFISKATPEQLASAARQMAFMREMQGRQVTGPVRRDGEIVKCRLAECDTKTFKVDAARHEGYCARHWMNLLSWHLTADEPVSQ